MRADRRDPVIAQLRRFKPTRFEATCRDGTKKQIPLATKANRWELLSDTLEVIPWVSIEALDADGNVLGAIDREGELVEEDIEVARGEGFARIIVSAVTSAMAETRKMFADAMRCNQEMAHSMMESQRVLVDSYQLALNVQRNALQQIGESQPQQDNVMEMMKLAAMMYRGQTPQVGVTVTPPAPTPPKPANPTPPNGARKPGQ